jgi:hypothetical protein
VTLGHVDYCHVLYAPVELSALFHPLPLSIALSQMLDMVLAVLHERIISRHI